MSLVCSCSLHSTIWAESNRGLVKRLEKWGQTDRPSDCELQWIPLELWWEVLLSAYLLCNSHGNSVSSRWMWLYNINSSVFLLSYSTPWWPHMAGALFTFFNLSDGQVCAVSAQQPEKMFVNASRGCMLLESFHAWDPCFSTLFGFDVLYVGLVWTSQH